MKKLFALMMLGLFVISLVPAALAEDLEVGEPTEEEGEPTVGDGEPAAGDGESSEEQGESSIRDNVVNAVHDRAADRVHDEAKERLKPVRIAHTPKPVKVAHKTTVEFEEAQERYDALKQNYAEHKTAYNDKKAEVDGLHDALNTCTDAGEDCGEERRALLVGANGLLHKSADAVVAALDKLADRVENAEDLDESSKEALLEEIAYDKQQVENALAALDEAKEDPSSEEVQEAIDNLRAALKESHPNFKRTVTLLVNAKLFNILENLGETAEGLNDKIAALGEEGYDVSALEDLMDNFEAAVASSEENHNEAQDLYIASFTDELTEEDMQAARDFQFTAREDLGDAKGYLSQIFQEIRSLEEVEGTDVLDEEGEADEEVTA